MALARRLPIEVISADSRQVYRGMDVATGKPTPDGARGRSRIIWSTSSIPTTATTPRGSATDAEAAIAASARRGRLPVVVGGTGLYIRALLRGLDAAPPADPDFRGELVERRRARRAGGAARAAWPTAAPALARRLHPNDEVRVIRALERLRGGSRRRRGAGAVAA